jgi:hypothetical protein
MCNEMKLDYTKEDFVQHAIKISIHNNFVITRKEDTHA